MRWTCWRANCRVKHLCLILKNRSVPEDIIPMPLWLLRGADSQVCRLDNRVEMFDSAGILPIRNLLPSRYLQSVPRRFSARQTESPRHKGPPLPIRQAIAAQDSPSCGTMVKTTNPSRRSHASRFPPDIIFRIFRVSSFWTLASGEGRSRSHSIPGMP